MNDISVIDEWLPLKHHRLNPSAPHWMAQITHQTSATKLFEVITIELN